MTANQAGSWVVGAEADVSGANLTGSTTCRSTLIASGVAIADLSLPATCSVKVVAWVQSRADWDSHSIARWSTVKAVPLDGIIQSSVAVFAIDLSVPALMSYASRVDSGELTAWRTSRGRYDLPPCC